MIITKFDDQLSFLPQRIWDIDEKKQRFRKKGTG